MRRRNLRQRSDTDVSPNATRTIIDVPSEVELVYLIAGQFLMEDRRLPRQRSRQLCNATLQSIPHTNLNLDSSILYQAGIQVDGDEILRALVVEPGIQSKQFQIDKQLVVLELPFTVSADHRDVRAFISQQSALVLLEHWRDISVRTIDMLQSLNAGGIVLIDDRDAVSCIKHYKQAGFPRLFPVVVIKESDGKKLLQQRSDNGKHLVCKLTVETAMERECSICFERMDVAMKLPKCGHVIHEACGMRWLRANKSCPFCRHELKDIHDFPNQDVASNPVAGAAR